MNNYAIILKGCKGSQHVSIVSENNRPGGLHLSDHYGTVECIRVVNTAYKYN